MSESLNYTPGHFVHFIQSRLALEGSSQWRQVDIVEIGKGIVKIQEFGEITSFKCIETTRMRKVYKSGRVPQNADGVNFAILAPHDVLIIPCADVGKTFPPMAPISPYVCFFIKGGAAQYSPTTDGAWHTFSICAE